MPDPVTRSQLAALAAQLPPDERRQLAETILRDLASSLCGADAQAWVSGSRGGPLTWDEVLEDKLPIGRPTPGPESLNPSGDDLLF